MMNLLIVDDEPIIADGLYELMQEKYPCKLRVYKAYSASAALAYAQSVKLDIVISDVLMPEMNGLAMQSLIRKRWPSSEFIFVTGHDDFVYVQQAIRNGSLSFILKTEDDELILRAVDEAIAKLEAAFKLDSLIQSAQEQLRRALPLLQNQMFEQWLSGDKGSPADMAEQMRQLEFPLDPDADILPVLFRMQPMGDASKAFFGMQAFSVLQSAISSLLPHTPCMCFRCDAEHTVAVFQGGEDYASVVLGTLEQLQEVYADQTAQKLSIAACRSGIQWHRIDAVAARLRSALHRSLGSDALLTYDPNTAATGSLDAGTRLNHSLRAMSALIRNRQREAFAAELDHMFHMLDAQDRDLSILRSEAVLRLFSMASEALIEFHGESQIDLFSYLAAIDARKILMDWQGIKALLGEVFGKVFDLMQVDSDARCADMLKKLHTYIAEHLCEDLSLTKLGAVVSYSSTYLSTLYKSLTGKSLVDYIGDLRIQKAKTLLGEEHVRIRTVAIESGFESQQYFHRYFKKKMNMTPSEYRNLVLSRKSAEER